MTSIPSAEGVREQAFERSGNSGSRAAWWFVGGAALIAFMMVGFVLAILSDAGQFTRHAMTTLPAIMAVAAISAGVGALRTPRRVVVDDRGIRIHFPGRSLTLAWSDIGWAATGTGIMNSSLHLALFDKKGKRLAIISQGLGDFDTLVDVVMQRVSSTAGDEAQAIRMRKAKRSAVLVIAGALGLLGVAGANAWFAYDEQRSVSLLASAGVPGEAVILDRFIAPNGVTRRLEYEITSPTGETATRNAEVEPAVWESLANAKTVPVVYVPHEPSISRLAAGEVIDDDPAASPIMMYGLSALVAAMSLLLFVGGALQWRGWDIDLDSKTGKLSIKRFGEGR